MPQGLSLTATGLVVTAGRGAVELRALGGGGCVAIAAPGLHAFVIAGEELWIAADGPMLARYDLRGLRIGEPTAVSPPRDDCALLGGAPGVAWLGAPVQLIKVAADGLHVETVADADLAISVTQSRRLVAGRGTLSLHELYEIRWSIPLGPGARARDAALVLDGRAVAVVVASIAAQAILVVGLRDGAVLHRVAVPPNAHVHLAPQRGVAMIHQPPARLVLVDLRFGRVLFEHDEQRSLAEVAIDPTGSLAALRLADGELVGVAVRDLAAYARTPAPAAAPLATVERSAAINDNGVLALNASDRFVLAGGGPDGDDVAAVHPPAAASDPFACDATITAFACLAPRLTIEPLTREESREAVRYERDLAYARVILAVARSWDTGKLAYPNTGRLPFHSELSGGLGGAGNLAPSEVADASVRFAGALAACAAFAARSSPRRAPIERLATEIALSPLACDIVRTITAPLLWGDLARPYGILANDEARPLCDEVLLGQILADEDSRAIAIELDPEARLITTGIVRVGTGRVRPFLPLVVDPIVLRLLRDAELDGELAPVIRVRTADRTFAELCIPGPTKAVLIEQLRTAPAPLRLVVRGRTGSGRHALLAAVAAAAGRRLAQIDASATARDPMRTGELRTALERAHLAGHLPCIDGLDAVADDPASRHVQAVIDAHHGPLAVRLAWDTRPPLTPGYTLCDLPPLAAADRILAWRGALARHDLAARELDNLVERYAIGPGIAELVARTVAASPPPGDAGAALEIAVRQHLANRLGSTADRVLRLASWSQIVLPADIQDSLVELMARIKHRRTVFEQWGFDRVATNARGVTALFQGAPGTGKTLVATAIANELGMDLYRVDLSRIMSKWIGETEQNLARLFDAAEDGNTIVLFDEADSLFAKRTEVRTSVDRYANLEVNYLLQRIDRFEGIAILTTNFGTSIDSAFKRRLSMRLTFPFPDEEMREKLWEAHLPAELPRAGALDLAMLAQRYQLSGGYIRNCAMRAAFLAAEEHAPLSAEHLDRAVRAEFREIGKLADTGTLE